VAEPDEFLNDNDILSHLGDGYSAHNYAVVPPIYMNSLHVVPKDAIDDARPRPYTYGRVSNPTVNVFERKIAALERAERSLAFASGMGAISAAILANVKGGDHIVAVETAYGPTRIFLDKHLGKFGIETFYVSGEEVSQFEKAARGQSNKITLTMVESLTNPGRTKILREIADAYQAAHPNIVIEIIFPPLDGADQKIQQMLMNKNDMDIFEVRDLAVAQFSSNNFIEPLDEYIKNWSDAATLVDNVKTAATLVGGKWYLIPYGFYMKMLYYRADWLKEAGIPAPTTVSELFAAAKALTNPAIGRYGRTLRGVSGGWGMIGDIVRARLGTKGIDTREPNFTKDGKLIYGTPEVLEAFNAMFELYKTASPSDAISWGFQDQCQAFTSGVTAFLYQDPEAVAVCQQNMRDGTWAMIPPPVDDVSRQFPVTTGYAGWGLAPHSKHKQEAADFIMFLSNPANNAKFRKQYSVIPIHRAGAIKRINKKGGRFG
jgi:multiple sugar transport system substrate-binding protein